MNEVIKPAGNEIVAFCDKVANRYEQLKAEYHEATKASPDENYLRNIEYKYHEDVRTLLNKTNNMFDSNTFRFTFDYGLLHRTKYRSAFEHQPTETIVNYVFRAMILDIEQDFVDSGRTSHAGQSFWRDMREKIKAVA